MSKPAFIVDGQMEQRIIQTICPGVPVHVLGCNGKKVAAEAISKRIASHSRLLKIHFPVIVILDLETRDCSTMVFREQIIVGLRAEAPNAEIRLVIADRMTENWILSDPERLAAAGISTEALPKDVEGADGKSLLSRGMPAGRYHETTDGVELFLNTRPHVVGVRSASFQALIQAAADINCAWLAGCH